DIEIEKPGKKFYVAVERLRPVFTNAAGKQQQSFHGTSQMDRVCTKALEAGILKGAATPGRVYGLKKNSKFLTHPDWIEITAHIKAEHAKLMANAVINKSMSLIDSYFHFR